MGLLEKRSSASPPTHAWLTAKEPACYRHYEIACAPTRSFMPEAPKWDETTELPGRSANSFDRAA